MRRAVLSSMPRPWAETLIWLGTKRCVSSGGQAAAPSLTGDTQAQEQSGRRRIGVGCDLHGLHGAVIGEDAGEEICGGPGSSVGMAVISAVTLPANNPAILKTGLHPP